jgi:hypothetical protein
VVGKKIREATTLIFGEATEFESLSPEDKLAVANIAALQELDTSLMEVVTSLDRIYNSMPE